MPLDLHPSSNYPTNVRGLLGITSGGAVPLMPTVGLHNLDLPYVNAQRGMGNQDSEGWEDDDDWVEAALMEGKSDLAPTSLVDQRTQKPVEISSIQSEAVLSDVVTSSRPISIDIPGSTSISSSSLPPNSRLQSIDLPQRLSPNPLAMDFPEALGPQGKVASQSPELIPQRVQQEEVKLMPVQDVDFSANPGGDSSEVVSDIEPLQSFSPNLPAINQPEAPLISGKKDAVELTSVRSTSSEVVSAISTNPSSDSSEVVSDIEPLQSFSPNLPAINQPEAPLISGKKDAVELTSVRSTSSEVVSAISTNPSSDSSEVVSDIEPLQSFSPNLPAINQPEAPLISGKKDALGLTAIQGIDFSVNPGSGSSEVVSAINSPQALSPNPSAMNFSEALLHKSIPSALEPVQNAKDTIDSPQIRLKTDIAEFPSGLEPLVRQFVEPLQGREALRNQGSTQQMTAQIEALERQVATLSSQVSTQREVQQSRATNAAPPSPTRVVVQAPVARSEAPPAFWERSYVSRLSRW